MIHTQTHSSIDNTAGRCSKSMLSRYTDWETPGWGSRSRVSQLQQFPLPENSFRPPNFPAVIASNDRWFTVTHCPVISSYEIPSHPREFCSFVLFNWTLLCRAFESFFLRYGSQSCGHLIFELFNATNAKRRKCTRLQKLLYKTACEMLAFYLNCIVMK
jgi:hypothetical protein